MPTQPVIHSFLKCIHVVNVTDDDPLLAFILIARHNGHTTEVGRIPFMVHSNPAIAFTAKRSAFHQIKRLAQNINALIVNVHEHEPCCPQCGNFTIVTHTNPPKCTKCAYEGAYSDFLISLDETVHIPTPEKTRLS